MNNFDGKQVSAQLIDLLRLKTTPIGCVRRAKTTP